MGTARRLSALGKRLKDEFEEDYTEYGGCSCHINPPCGYCTHHGNPANLEETPEAWETEINMKPETDPTGLLPSDPGAKLDRDKPKCAQILRMFSRALWEVSRVGTFGAAKYSMGGWQFVDDGANRYADAEMRHWLKRGMGHEYDSDSRLLHLSQECWNKLAELELYLRDHEDK